MKNDSFPKNLTNLKLLQHLLNNPDLIEKYNKDFSQFYYELKKLIEKGYKYLKHSEDRTLTYFRVEQIFSLLCYMLQTHNVIEKYNSMITEIKEFETIEERIEKIKLFLEKIETEEIKKNKSNTFYLEYIT